MVSPQENEILYYTFNQDLSCIAIGTKTGFKIFMCMPFQLLYSYENGGISIIEMLYNTNLIALVGSGEQPEFSPRRLTLWNTSNSTILCELSFLTKIQGVKMNKQRLIVEVKDQFHIYDILNMKPIHSLEINSQLTPRSALSPSPTNCFLAYSDSISDGSVNIFDAFNLTSKTKFTAHKSPVLKLSFNNSGNLLATASCKGTIIRIFSIPKGEKLVTFKRGIQNAYIYCMNFSLLSKYILVSSSSGTIHVFHLDNINLDNSPKKESPTKKPENKGWSIGSLFKKTMEIFTPGDIESLAGERSIMTINEQSLKSTNIVAMSDSNTELYALTSDGKFHVYKVNSDKKEVKQSIKYNIFDQKVLI